MPLESGTTIADLNPSWPLGTDGKSQGDDHIRLIKSVLVNLYPVGSLYMTANDTNPQVFLGGTWAAHAQGRALVGVGDNDESTWIAGEERGTETHTLVDSELPAHAHSVAPPSTETTGGEHTHSYTDAGSNTTIVDAGNLVNAPVSTAAAVGKTTGNSGGHQHTLEIAEFNTGTAGSDAAHNNIQPSVAVYVWQRTA